MDRILDLLYYKIQIQHYISLTLFREFSWTELHLDTDAVKKRRAELTQQFLRQGKPMLPEETYINGKKVKDIILEELKEE